MYLTLVRFRLDRPISLEDATRRFALSAPKYLGVQGLIRKHYVCSDDGLTVGGVYLWKSRDDAEACYAGEWRDRVRVLYGVEPEISWFDSPIGVDNLLGELI
ncbi:MAG: monooxygenase [Phyllobacteriaceae bacterium]|nr:monooxygenase [Phyllobacteriaceae bacterium]